jgi:hypothetical protein
MVPEVLVIGGDEAGAFHARALTRALGAQAVRVLSSDWLLELGTWIGHADPADQLVPSPLMPHLLWQWLALELGVAPAPVPRGWDLPFESPGREGELYLSAAAWRCPATCIEPPHCPVLHGPRDWDLATMIEQRAMELGYTPAVFRVRTYAMGVGSVPAGDLQAAAQIRTGKILVGTSSHCHAAIGALAKQDAGKLSTRL